MRTATDRTTAIKHVLQLTANADGFDIDAMYDSLYLVPAEGVSCNVTLCGVAGPNGSSWAWGEDDSDLPPWISPDELIAAEVVGGCSLPAESEESV